MLIRCTSRRPDARRPAHLHPETKRARPARRAVRPQPRLPSRDRGLRPQVRLASSPCPPSPANTALHKAYKTRCTSPRSSTTRTTRSACGGSATGTRRRARTSCPSPPSRARASRARCAPRAGPCATSTRWRALRSSVGRTRSRSSKCSCSCSPSSPTMTGGVGRARMRR